MDKWERGLPKERVAEGRKAIGNEEKRGRANISWHQKKKAHLLMSGKS